MKRPEYKSLARVIFASAALFVIGGCTSDSPGELPPAVSMGPLVLSAEIDRWDDDEFELTYTLQNTTDETFAVFDDYAGAMMTLNENRLRLFKGKFELGPDFLSVAPITIKGRYSMARQELAGTADTEVPFSQSERYDGGLISIAPRSPDELEFCVGYLNVDELPALPSDGEFQLSSSNPYPQQLACVGVKRSEAPLSQTFANNNTVMPVSVTILDVDDDSIDFVYELTNASTEEIVVFDDLSPAGSEFYLDLYEGGVPRLYIGRILGPNQTDSGGTSVAGGRLVSIGETISRSGGSSSDRLEGWGVYTSDEELTKLDICLGYAPADITLPTQIGEGQYDAEANLEDQQFACVRVLI